jgi:hypothetical protein
MRAHHYLLNKEWQPTIVYPESMNEGREKDYKTLSWKPLIKTETTEEVKEETTATPLSLEKAHDDFRSIFGKNVPINKKNDIEWIQEKINETLTPAK